MPIHPICIGPARLQPLQRYFALRSAPFLLSISPAVGHHSRHPWLGGIHLETQWPKGAGGGGLQRRVTYLWPAPTRLLASGSSASPFGSGHSVLSPQLKAASPQHGNLGPQSAVGGPGSSVQTAQPESTKSTTSHLQYCGGNPKICWSRYQSRQPAPPKIGRNHRHLVGGRQSSPYHSTSRHRQRQSLRS